MSAEPRDVLLVEDDPDDVMLLRQALLPGRGLIRLAVAENGEEALAYLRREGRFADAPRPALVLLDLKLPKLSGVEVLREIRADARLRSLPVIVMTTSSAEADVQQAYALGANCFLPKPTGLAQLRLVAGLIEDLWFDCARLP